jgi:hypothetical protein
MPRELAPGDKMQIIMAVLSLALVMWDSPASAQKTYSVSVSQHSSLPALSDADLNDILAKASKVLQKEPGHQDADGDVKCDVTFTLQGPVRTFPSPGAVVHGDLGVAAVHQVAAEVTDADFHVKVVEKIRYCRGKFGRANGCAYHPRYRSIIVVHPKMHRDRDDQLLPDFPDHVLWAHEFGHLTGLGHRKDSRALMTNCGVTNVSVRVNREECRCLLAGPGSCRLPPALWCSPQ